MTTVPFDRDGAAPEADLVSTLAARVAEMEEIVRTTTEVVDEKTLKELRRTVEAISKRDPKFEERVTNRIDNLAERVETVAKTVSTASAALAAKDGEIAQLRRELEGTLAGVNGAIAQAAGRGADPAELAEMRRALDEFSKLAKERLPRGLENRVDELAAKVDLVAQRVDSVSSTISTTAAGLAGREGDMNALRRAFEAQSDRVAAELAELRRGTDPTAVVDLRQALKEVTDETARRQHAVHNQLGQAGAKLDALTSRVSGTEENLSAFRSYFEEAGGRLSTLIAEQHRSLATLTAQTAALAEADADAARTLDDRVREFRATVDDVARRLEPLTATVTATTERLDARDEAVEALEHRFQEASSRVDELVVDLSRALAELPDPNDLERALAARIDEVAGQAASASEAAAVLDGELSSLASRATALEEAGERASHELDARVGRLSSKVDALTRQLEPLTTAVAATTQRMDASDGVVQALDIRFQETSSRVDDVAGQAASASEAVSTLDNELTALHSRTSAIENAVEHANGELAARVGSLSGKLDALARQVEASTSATSTTGERLAEAEEAITSLRDYVDTAGTRLSSQVAEHGRALAALDSRTESLEQSGNETTSALDDRIAAATHGIDELAGRIEELAASLQAAAEDRAETASEIARVAAILEVERVAVHAQLGELAEAVKTTTAGPGQEELGRHVAALVARVDALDDERVSARAQFEAIAKALSSIPQRSSLEQQLDELSRRLDEVEHRGAAVATKVSHASALLPTALRSLEARLDEVAPGSRAPAESEAPAQQSEGPDDEAGTAPPPVDAIGQATATVVPFRAGDP